MQRRGRGFAELPQGRRGWELRSWGPGGEGRRTPRRAAEGGGRSGALRPRGCVRRRPQRGGGRLAGESAPPGAGRAALGAPGRAGDTPTAISFPEGAPVESGRESWTELVWREALRQRCAGWGGGGGGQRGGTGCRGGTWLRFSTKGSLKLPPGVEEEKARKKRIRGFFDEWKMFPGCG